MFHLYFAGSAASLNLISHLAGQFQRNYRVVIFCATSGQFINSWKYLRGGYYVNSDWFSNKCFEAVPLDKAYRDSATDIVVIRSREENHSEPNKSIEIKRGYSV